MSQDKPDKDERKLTDRKATVPATRPSSNVQEASLGYKDRYSTGELEEEYVGVPHCEVGGEPIKEGDYHLCTICERPMCKAHAIFYENRPYCQKHAHQASDIVKLESLSLKDAEVLVALHNRIFGVGDIGKLARITENDVYTSLASLSKHSLIRKESTMIFLKYFELTMEGAEALPLLYAMHKQKGAMKQFVAETNAWMMKKGRVFSVPETESKEEEKDVVGA